MDKNKAWEVFASTGKVEDYLKFKAVTNSSNAPFNTVINNASEEDKDRRTDNKTTEYR